MRFRKLNKEVELPEKSTPNKYINIRASRRIDIKPGKTRDVTTGVEVLVPKNEICWLSGDSVLEAVLEPGKYRELIITMHNPSRKTMMIYPGQVIASITVEVISTKAAKKLPKYKRTTFSSEVTLIRDGDAGE